MAAIDDIAQKLLSVFEKYQEIVFAYLFGSLAEGIDGPASDVDIAVHVSRPAEFSFSRKLELHGDCCRALKRSDVDLVVLNQTCNLLLIEQVLRRGKMIFSRDPAVLDDFFLRKLHEAIDFRQQRNKMMGV